MRTPLVLLGCAVTVLGAALLSSCGDDSVSPGGSAGPSWTAWRNPRSPDAGWYNLNAMWGSSSSDVYAVGDGAVIHFDGQQWSVVHHDEGVALYGVWGSPGRGVLCVGAEGTILHYDGTRWDTMASGTSAGLYGVWGDGWFDVWAVGEGGTVLHFDGAKWRTVNTGIEQTLRKVWGNAIHVYAVGDEGTVLELTGGNPRKIDVGTTNDLMGIGGSSATGLCVVGAMGTVLVPDGSGWRGVRSGTTADLRNVCGTSDGYLVAVGDWIVLRSDGGDWQPMEVPLDVYTDVWGSSMGNLLVLGLNYDAQSQQIVRFDGSVWSTFELPAVEFPPGDEPGETLVDAWGTSGSSVYAAGVSGTVLHYDGVDWTSSSMGVSGIGTIWGVSETEVYAVGNRFILESCEFGRCYYYLSSVYCFDGTAWTIGNEFRNKWMNGIWGTSGDNLFAVGSVEKYHEGQGPLFDSYRTILHFDGTAWNTVVEGTAPGRFSDVWGSSENDVYAVGWEGTIYHYDGTVWTEMMSGTGVSLNAVWGGAATDVIAVGDGGTIIHFDGQSWTPMASPTASAIFDLWGSAMNDVYAVGDGGVILHYDGTRWSAAMSPTSNTLQGIWGSASEDVFAVGDYGTICHYGSR